MIKKVTRIFEACWYCPFCSDRHIKEINGYYVKYMCRKSQYREIDKKNIDTIPDWCPLEEETVTDFTKRGHIKKEKEEESAKKLKRCD